MKNGLILLIQIEMKQRLNLLRHFETGYRNDTDSSTVIGKLNLAILDKKDCNFEFANEGTVCCLALVENLTALEKLLSDKPTLLNATAFKIALMTNNQKLISFMAHKLLPNQYPEDIVRVLSLCSAETRKLLAITHNKLQQDILAQSHHDKKLCDALFEQGLQTQLSENQGAQQDQPEPMAIVPPFYKRK